MRMRALGRVAAATALAAAASLLTTSGAGATDAPLRDPQYAVPTQAKTVFNDPMSTEAPRRDAIRNELIDLIQRADVGSEISGAVYLFTDVAAADALIAAHARGVKVRLVVDHKTTLPIREKPNEAHARLTRALGTTPSATGSYVYACPVGRGCIGTRTGLNSTPINHNKFFLFSKVGGVQGLVFQTSSNLTTSQRENFYNNAVVIPHTGLHKTYRDYHADLVAYGQQTGLTHYNKTRQDGPYETFFFPRQETQGAALTEPATDTVVSVLNNVRCLPGGGTKVRIGMFAFTRVEVAKKLASLGAQGCQVYVFYNEYIAPDSGDSVSDDVRKALSDGNKLKGQAACNAVATWGAQEGVGLHSKYLLVEGAYGDVDDTALVFTGSANYTVPTLRGHDETMLKISDRSVYQQFENNFDDVLSGLGTKQGICRPAATHF